MLKRARGVLERHRAPANLAAADLLRIPIRDGVARAILNVGVLQHVAEADRALAEMRRVMDADGFAVIVTLNRRSFHAAVGFLLRLLAAWRQGRAWPTRHAIRRSVTELVREAAGVGLELREVRGVYLMPRGLRCLERLLDSLDWVRLARRPLLLPLANAFLVTLTPRSG